MEIKQIKALADILNKNGLTSIEVCEGELKIKIEKTYSVPAVPAAAGAPVVTASAVCASVTAPFIPEETLSSAQLKSPMVGVFYSAPSPDSQPFVKTGAKVKKGDVLCIIEAMKLMNEITAENDGEIAEICVKNGDIVEFGQTLFKFK